MIADDILATAPLGSRWQTLDPFLFCVHHDDAYPPGNEHLGPDPSLLRGRDIGMDFAAKDGWSMYHGDVVPGFPRHPHRGFETVTLARRGYVDHSDSLGAAARFGQGDVQWMTAGRGVVHSEMFPLVHRERDNPTELFQIWLNLPAEDKLKDAYFTMFWAESLPRVAVPDDAGRGVEVVFIAGAPAGHAAPPPPPSSWASRVEAAVAIWTVAMAPGARWTLPAAAPGLNRVLYLFAGRGLEASGRALAPGHAAQVRPEAEIVLANGPERSELLLLQGRPIGEPVVQHGPFVMNTTGEIHEAIADYHATGFGGWPWKSDGPVHERGRGRFALRADRGVELPPGDGA